MQKPCAPHRDFDIDLRGVDVIYAEDDEIFREATVRRLITAGFSKQNIRECSNGLDCLLALANAQSEGNLTMPLVVILDVRMPDMDGRETALHIQELSKKRMLSREPFVISISSLYEQVTVQEGRGNFQVVVPKPFDSSNMMECIHLLTRWWTVGEGRSLPAFKSFNVDEIDIIVACEEPLCRLHAAVAFGQAGASHGNVAEAEDEEELFRMLSEAQEKDAGRPLVLILMEHKWAVKFQKRMAEGAGIKHKWSVEAEQLKRQPFIIFTPDDDMRRQDMRKVCKMGVAEMAAYFDAFLPSKFSKRDVEWSFELLRLWWLTRGDGPVDPQESSTSESE